jgi:hypothetical protein
LSSWTGILQEFSIHLSLSARTKIGGAALVDGPPFGQAVRGKASSGDLGEFSKSLINCMHVSYQLRGQFQAKIFNKTRQRPAQRNSGEGGQKSANGAASTA